MKTSRITILTAATRILIGAIFVYAGIVKLQTPAALAASIASYGLVPTSWIANIAQALPFLEAISGFWLILSWRHRVPALAILMMTAVFFAIILQAILRGLKLDCGCFGENIANPPWVSFVRDLLLLIGAWLVFRATNRSTFDRAKSE